MNPSPASRAAIGVCFGLLVAVAWIYAPVRGHEYLDYDDMALLVWNPDIQVDSVREALRNAFLRPQASGWVPLTTLSHQLDRAVFGLWAPGALLVNVSLHATASLLLFVALWRLSDRLGASAFAAGIFAVHPLHVESVAWAIERKDVLSAFFFSALLLCYAHYAQSPSSGRRYAAVILCLALGLSSKPMLVTAPFVLLLLDYWPLQRLDRAAWREKRPMFALVLVVIWLTLWSQAHGRAFDFGAELPLWARILNAVHAIGAYGVDTLWPSGLAPHYPHPGVALPWAQVGAAALGVIALSAGAWYVRKTQPWWLVGWLWFVGMLVPVSGLVQVGLQARADRYTYLPLIGLSWAVGIAVDRATRATPKRRRAAAALAVACLVALGAVAAKQVHYWRDSRSLYQRIRSVHPEAAFPELRLGMVELIEGRFDLARPHLLRALELDPQRAPMLFHQIGSLASHQASRDQSAPARATLRFGIELAVETGHPDQASGLRLQRGLLLR